jgi:hypothetical protein
MMAVSHYTEYSIKYLTLLKKDPLIFDLVSGRTKPVNKYQEKALVAYKDYVKTLSGHEQSLEKKDPLSSVLMTFENILKNIDQIEDNFSLLFKSMTGDNADITVRSSSLVVVGYLEAADNFSTWFGHLAAHLRANQDDLIPPYWTKELDNESKVSAKFASDTLNRWNPSHKGLIQEVLSMQKKGTDVAIKTGNTWLDEFIHDNQFSDTEQDLMSRALRNPIMMFASGHIERHQRKIDLLNSRKDWLVAKVAMEEAKLGGMGEDSPEYKKLKKAIDHYATLVTKYEQKIERMRA